MPEFSHECFLQARKKTRFSKVTQEVISEQIEKRTAQICSANQYQSPEHSLDSILPDNFGYVSYTKWCDKNNSWFVGGHSKIACVKNSQFYWIKEITVEEDGIWCSSVKEIVLLPSGKLMVISEANQLRKRKALIAIFEINGELINYLIAAQYPQVNISKAFALDNNTVTLFSSVDYPKVDHLTLEAWEITHDENWETISLNAIRCRTPIAIGSINDIVKVDTGYYLFGNAYFDDTLQDILVKWDSIKHDFIEVLIFELEWRSHLTNHFFIEVDCTKLLMISTANVTINEDELIVRLWDTGNKKLIWQISYLLPKASMDILSFKYINESSAIVCLKDKCYPNNHIYYCEVDIKSGKVESVLEPDDYYRI